jgi:serine/threonine-protein kinase
MGVPVAERRETLAKVEPSSAQAPPQQATARAVETASSLNSIDAQAVDRVSRELAGYLGPIANVIVRKAAQRCNSLEELCSSVAREIVSDADRARFLRSFRP